MKSYLPLILGMAAVTYIPRLLPLITLTNRELNPLLRRFLTYIPYTALSTIIVKGLIDLNGSMLVATFIGLVFGGVLSWFKGNMVLSVGASIIATFFILQM
ncbi:AzlD domain-containing protein [Clostridium sp. HMP27]|uniref:AzlD domain-containing protein n=1 Tax=Clostridium sp. HMP27 TaxID=1487921 RepID=UPI00052B5A83|nr:AzlD domain-containing protein [Clostridium sp. HMP27]KGK89544.1 branched-chain amino acid transporter [Clostridium sp. HMP27]